MLSKFKLYTSAVSHFSMEKSCHLLGLGYDAVVKVPTNDKMQMDIQVLLLQWHLRPTWRSIQQLMEWTYISEYLAMPKDRE